MSRLLRKVAILGSGIMGSQIAAHIATAGIKVILFDLPSNEKDRNKIVVSSIQNLKKMNPQPYGSLKALQGISIANYEDDLDKLRSCDLIIEAIAEKLEWKLSLYEKVLPYLNEEVVFATNTSGISLQSLMKDMPIEVQRKFIGIHFFNPPRYLALVEIISHSGNTPKLLNDIESFLTRMLGKTVIRAKDTPNFIGNRIGVFCIVAIMQYAAKYQIAFDIADALTGRLIGHPKSATFRTADLVGLDTLIYVMNNILQLAKDDPWYDVYAIPSWLKKLVDFNRLGQKTKGGIYKKKGNDLYVLDPTTEEYTLSTGKPSKELLLIFKEKDLGKRFELLRKSQHPEAKFLYSIYMDSFHYAAYHVEYICDTVSDIDISLRCGYGWDEGLFETWQKIGWNKVSKWIQEHNESNSNLISVSLPKWVTKVEGVYNDGGRYSPCTNEYSSRSKLDVYKRQYFPLSLLNETEMSGDVIFENEGVVGWVLDDNVLILSFKSKLGAIGSYVLEGISEVIDIAERDGFSGIVIWQKDHDHFSVGANLEEFGMAYMLDGSDAVRDIIKNFQKTMLMIRYSSVPVVCAVKGYALGGGCELVLHCDKAVAAIESYIGLVEVGVGLVPAGGGCKEMTLRSYASIDPDKMLQKYYKNIAMGEVAKSAQEAKEMGYLRDSDIIIMNSRELLYIAKEQVKLMSAANYKPPFQESIPAAGTSAKATIEMLLANMRAGQFISKYDYEISEKIAGIMTGGGVDKGTALPEEWYLNLEINAFVSLADNQETQDRIQYMLTNGKPLRN